MSISQGVQHSFQSPGSIGTGQLPYKNSSVLHGDFKPVPLPKVNPGEIQGGPQGPQDLVTISRGADGSESVGGFQGLQGNGSLSPHGTPVPLLPDIRPGSLNVVV